MHRQSSSADGFGIRHSNAWPGTASSLYKFSSHLTGNTIHLRSVVRNSDHRVGPSYGDSCRIYSSLLVPPYQYVTSM
jgi:hypothetical protein